MRLDDRPWNLLFVCSGNICRSPMAEGLARAYALQRGLPVQVRSAGTLGISGHPPDPHAAAVCREVGVHLDGHVSQGIDGEMVDWADYVLVMEYAHATTIRERHPQVGEKILLLGTFGGQAIEIADPLGGWRFQFRRSRDEIQRCVEVFIDRLPAKRP